MPDHAPEYVLARAVLLDALGALGSQRDAVVLVGAQAVYMRTGDAGITTVAPYTTDADLALEPGKLADSPLIETLMGDADFQQRGNPGVWFKMADLVGTPTEIEVDIMVPDRFARGGGRRSVRLPPHHRLIARRAVGLEGSLIDNDLMEVAAFDPSDPRRFNVRVAGPAALIVAKAYKLHDRIAEAKEDRIADKDAADVYRLMLTVPVREFLARLRPLLDDETAGPVCRRGLELVEQLFGAPRSDGVRMAADALRIAVPTRRIADVCTGFVRQARVALEGD